MLCPICGKPMKQVAEDSLSKSWRCQNKECSIERLAVRADRPDKVEEELPNVGVCRHCGKKTCPSAVRGTSPLQPTEGSIYDCYKPKRQRL